MSKWSWANVEDDLLFLLVERVVGVIPFIRVSAVCKTWFLVASATKCRNPIPLLMLSEDENSDIYDFYDHSIGELYQISIPQALNKKIVGSVDGWLITASIGGGFQLLNPLNQTHIDLPSATTFPFMKRFYYSFTEKELRDFFIAKAICSIDSKGNYIVVAIHMGWEYLISSYCRAGCEKWFTFDLKRPFDLKAPQGISYINGKFFLVTRFDEICTIDFTPTPNLVKIAELPSDGIRSGEYQCYVVECGGLLFLVRKYYVAETPYRKLFYVYEIDLENKKVNLTWDIGDYALFVGINNAISIPITNCTKGIRKNCIYFTEDLLGSVYCRKDGEDMGVYDIRTRKFCAHYQSSELNSLLVPVWVMLDFSM